jgi:hypothetical protein
MKLAIHVVLSEVCIIQRFLNYIYYVASIRRIEEIYLLAYTNVQSVESRPTFRRKVDEKRCCMIYAGFLLLLLLNPEYGRNIYLRNVG